MPASHKYESTGDLWIVVKVWLVASGIYIWEFVTTLDFEWNVIRRHQRYRWTIWIYTFSRLSGLAVIMLILINAYNRSPINCQAWVTSGWAFSALGGYGLSSILIMIRIYAIWDKSKIIMAVSAAIWVINLGFQIAGIVKIRAEWVLATRACAIANVEVCRDFYINMIVTDVILLSIMLAGLLRLRLGGGGSFYISHLLWKQGVIWLAIATSAELPQVLLLFLSGNDSLQVLFLVPSMVTVIIAATRTYRSLINSTDSHLSESGALDVQKAKGSASPKNSSVELMPSNRLEVMVHIDYNGEYSMSQTHHYGSYPSSDAQSVNNPNKPASDDNI